MRAYFNRFLFWLLVIAVVFPTSLSASWAGRHIAKYFDIDDQLVIGGFFFAAQGDQSLQGHSMKTGLQIATIAFRLSTRGKRRNETKEATP